MDKQGLREFLEILRLTERMQSADSPSVGDLAERAILLHAINEYPAARADAQAALALDPLHPDALLAGAIVLSPAHAEGLLGSEFASDTLRRRAVDLMEPDALPRYWVTEFSSAVRVTVIWHSAARLHLRGGQPEDSTQILGRRAVNGQHWVVSDHVLQRNTQADRHVALTCDGIEIDVTVSGLAPPAKPEQSRLPDAEPWILIPVHNGAATLARCLDSVARELDRLPTARALVIDDAARDPAIAPMLQRAARHPRITCLTQADNAGFVRTINAGLARVGAGPVLLLNSDTYLPPGTLSRLMAHLADPEVATVTPLSNNGGSVSIPQPNRAYHPPTRRQADALARHAARLFDGQSVDVLTGNGFCMLISAKARAQVGPLSEAYQAGYYEEVDFCLRASQQGFRHIAAVDCFVLHVGGQSFGEMKRALVAANQKRLNRRFPFYPAAYRRFSTVDPLAFYRAKLGAVRVWNAQEVTEQLSQSPQLDFTALEMPLVCMRGDFPPEAIVNALQKVRFCPESWTTRYARLLHGVPFSAQMQDGALTLWDADHRRVAHLVSDRLAPPDIWAFMACLRGHYAPACPAL